MSTVIYSVIAQTKSKLLNTTNSAAQFEAFILDHYIRVNMLYLSKVSKVNCVVTAGWFYVNYLIATQLYLHDQVTSVFFTDLLEMPAQL